MSNKELYTLYEQVVKGQREYYIIEKNIESTSLFSREKTYKTTYKYYKIMHTKVLLDRNDTLTLNLDQVDKIPKKAVAIARFDTLTPKHIVYIIGSTINRERDGSTYHYG